MSKKKTRFFWAQFHVLFTFKEKTKCLWYLPLTCSLGEDYLGGDQKVKIYGEKSLAVSKSCYFHSNQGHRFFKSKTSNTDPTFI